MAAYFATSADYLERTTDLRAASATRTAMCWTRQHTLPTGADYNTGYAILDNTPATYNAYAGLFQVFQVAAQDVVDVFDGATETVEGEFSTAANTWTHHAWVYNTGTNTHTYYQNGVLIGSFVLNIDALVIVTDVCGGDSGSLGDVDVLYFRMWGAALSQAQIQAERLSSTVIRTTNLFMDTPLESDLLDLSGNGRDWSAIGSVSFSAAVPPVIPLNRTAETAITLPVVPFELGQTIPIGYPTGPINSNLWFSYTAPTDTLPIVGLWFSAPIAGEYQPQTFVWLGPVGSLTEYTVPAPFQIGEVGTDIPLTVPVTTGTTYFFQVANNGVATTAAATLTISGVVAPNLTAPVGSIAINSDVDGFPLALLSTVDGRTLQYRAPFPVGERGAVLPNGILLVGDEVTASWYLYSAALTVVATVPPPTGWIIDSERISHDHSHTFYVGHPKIGGAEVITISDVGTVGATTWVLAGPGLQNLAPNLAGTILYYAAANAIGLSAISQWDLVNDVALADLVATDATYAPSADLLVLSDGTLLMGYVSADPTITANVVRHFAADGTLLQQYTLDTPYFIDRLTDALDDPVSFWVWLHKTIPPGSISGNPILISRFLNIRVSDGFLLTDTGDARQYQIGEYRGEATDIPDRRFGHPQSCPFWIIRSELAGEEPEPPEPPVPPDVGPGGLEFDPTDIRWLRQTPVMSDENKAMLHRELTLDVEAGVGLRFGQGVDPLVMLRMSNDGGHTWHNLHPSSIGKRGEYRYRVNWHRLGQSRNRLYQFYGSDPVKICLIDAYTEIERGDGS